jgi:hypothetical protein
MRQASLKLDVRQTDPVRRFRETELIYVLVCHREDVGEDVESSVLRLLQAADYNVARAE